MTFDLTALAELLPAVVRRRDAEVGAELRAAPGAPAGRDPEDFGPLLSLLSVVAEQIRVLEDDLDRLHDDQFVETCADEVLPLLAGLLGATPPEPVPGGPAARTEVARTVPLRRRKGTVTALESVAAAATGWPALAVEYFRRIAATQHVNRLRLAVPAVADLRDGTGLAELSGPFDRVARGVDVRRIGRHRTRGRHNLPNVGVFLWRVAAARHGHATPFRLGPADPRFLFDPLGRDLPLVRRPAPAPDLDARAGPEHLPTPISRRALAAEAAAFYGPDASLCVFVDGEPLPTADVAACDLADLPGTGSPERADWQLRGRPDPLRIDPERGRFVLPAGRDGTVTVTFHAGAAAAIGGGEHDRAAAIAALAGLRVVRRVPGQPVDAALAELGGAGAVVLDTSETITGPVTLAPPPGATLVLVAGDGHRPVLILPGDLAVAAAPGSTTVLDGLVVAGGAVRVAAAGPAAVVIRDCTLVPGRALHRDGSPAEPDAPSLLVDGDEVDVRVERSILGGIVAAPRSAVSLRDAFVVAPAPGGRAFGGADGPGGQLSAAASTVLGAVRATSLGEVSDCLLPGAVAGEAPSVVVERRQEGCVRFSFLPLDALVPRRFRCPPETAAEERRVRPVFTSLRLGDPGFGQLAAATAREITEGAEDGSEMGAHHHLHQRARIANLRVRLGEFLPVAVEAGIVLEE